MCPAAAAEVRIMDSASALKLKSKGERGSPCLTPLLFLKKGPTSPLIDIAV
jgi:hypothetical protein